ncbi:MAG: hypothetical protein IAI49_09700, partial [Candidatus Eremiobacteraeota bacterium]|nr:hypothetical protein [Candidatus Eremiobacteraeota bacterium]
MPRRLAPRRASPLSDVAREPLAVGIAILAGGRATRLPGKLTAVTGSVPMIVRVLRNVCAASS